jgi:C_GCAxxG_C_C family probable redox protein
MTEYVDEADRLFKEGYACSQAILIAFGEELGLTRDDALRISSGFGGGMGCTGRTCGAATGALMVLGLRHGDPTASPRRSREESYKKSREFLERFADHCGSTECNTLLGHDLSTQEGEKAAGKAGLFRSLCPKLVRDAARILEEMGEEGKA